MCESCEQEKAVYFATLTTIDGTLIDRQSLCAVCAKLVEFTLPKHPTK